MTALDPALLPVFAPFEQATEGEIYLFQLLSCVGAATKEAYGAGPIPETIRAEHFVLNLAGGMRVQQSGWGEYFGPTLGSGEPNITEADLTYWLERARESAHPQLRARYADAVWDLTRPSVGTKPPFDSARIAVDAYLDASERITGAPIERRLNWLDRALQLALSTGSDQKERCVDALLAIATETDSMRAWMRTHGTVFRVRRVEATDEQRVRVVEALKRHAELELAAESVLPFQGEEASLYLADHFRRTGEPEKAQDLVRRYAHACLPTCRLIPAGWASGALSQLIELLTEYGLKEETTPYQLLLEERSREILGELAPIEASTIISAEEVEADIGSLIDEDLGETMARIWFRFVPTVKSMHDLASALNSGVVGGLLSKTIVDDSGRTITALPPYRDDPEAHLPLAYKAHVDFEAGFLALAIDRLKERHAPSVERLLEVLERGFLFGGHNRALLQRGLTACIEDDHICAAHVLIPLVEDALRTLLRALGRPAWQPAGSHAQGEQRVMTIGSVLADAAMEKYLQSSACKYLKMLLSDTAGVNLRNNVCHGLVPAAGFNRSLTDRLLHLLFGLSLLRAVEKEGRGGGSSPGGA